MEENKAHILIEDNGEGVRLDRKLVDKTNPRVEIALHVIERNGECYIVS